MGAEVSDVLKQGTSQFVRLSSGIVHHYVKTTGSGPPFLFLHGFLDSSRSFAALVEHFPHAIESYSIDQRGHGEAEAATSYAISDFTSDAIEFIERIIGERVILVGHSMGSIIAQRTALFRPDLVQKLVLIGAAPTAADHQGLYELQAEIAKFDGHIPRSFVEEFQRSTIHAPVAEATVAGYIDESMKVTAETWRGALSGMLDEPANDFAPVTVPTLVLWGAHDGVFGPEHQEALAHSLINGRAIQYENSGHAPHWEYPQRVARDIQAFAEEA